MRSIISGYSGNIVVKVAIRYIKIEKQGGQLFLWWNMNLVISKISTWKMSKIPSLENKRADWANYSELVIAHTAGFLQMISSI